MRKNLLFFIAILFIALGAAGYWYYQKNIYSKEVLKVEILGKNEVELAEEIEYLVKYKNNGDFRLEEPVLIFEYPKNSIVEGEKFLRKEIKLDDIYPGEEKTVSFKARIFGKEGEAKVAKAQISYRPKDIKSTYISETTFTTLIKSVPITFEFDLPSRVESGKEITFRLNYFSNVNYPLTDLGIKVQYPAEFEFLDSKPKALEKSEWSIGLLNRAQGGRIEISGTLSGELEESKIFHAEIGIWQDGEFFLLKESNSGIEIGKSSLYILQEINNNPKYIANPGDLLDYEITFKNIGDQPVENILMIVNLDGDAFDFDSVKVQSGRFEKEGKRIIWDYTMVPDLKNLLPTEEGKVEFWVKLKDDLPSDLKNPTIKDIVSLDNLREEFSTKINSKLEISQKGYFQDDFFGNSGPLPPKVGQITTYTIMWQVKNYYNDLKNVKIRAILPDWMKLTGEIMPKDSKFSFDSASKEIVWDLGNLAAGSGVSTIAPTVAFQVAFSPNSSQRGQTPDIIGEVKITANDTLTDSSIERTSSALNTTLPDDPSMTQGMGIVQ
jgi:hypothetical protein